MVGGKPKYKWYYVHEIDSLSNITAILQQLSKEYKLRGPEFIENTVNCFTYWMKTSYGKIVDTLGSHVLYNLDISRSDISRYWVQYVNGKCRTVIGALHI